MAQHTGSNHEVELREKCAKLLRSYRLREESRKEFTQPVARS